MLKGIGEFVSSFNNEEPETKFRALVFFGTLSLSLFLAISLM